MMLELVEFFFVLIFYIVLPGSHRLAKPMAQMLWFGWIIEGGNLQWDSNPDECR